VLSKPDPKLAIAGFGHHDAPTGIDPPVVCFVARSDRRVERVDPPIVVRRMDDRHAYIDLPRDVNLATVDLIGCGVAHPCEASERWRVLLSVARERRVVGAIPTFL
jgi:hypothetical protein